MLILKCCGHSQEEEEIENIISQSKLYNFEVTVKSPCDIESLKIDLNSGEKYKYLYLSAHGDADGFANTSESLNVPWLEFSIAICESECLTEDAILLLSCCRGGLNEIAYVMFWSCPAIQYVCGPRQNIVSSESIIAFNILLFNLTYRNLDPILSCENIIHGVNIRFKCFDRLETISEAGYVLFKQTQEDDSNKIQNIYVNDGHTMFKKNISIDVLEILVDLYTDQLEKRKLEEE